MSTKQHLVLSAFAGIFAATTAVASGDAPSWNHGQADSWGEISEEYKVCGIGQAQSPIDIPSKQAIEAEPAPLAINWQSFTPEVVNNGHTIQANTDGQAGTVTLGGKDYKLLQYHFHHLSEHTVDGEHAPMEVHFVHQSDAGDLLVVGVLINEGVANPNLAALWEVMPQDHGEARAKQAVNPEDLLPENKAAYRYKGSLTTPPCSEIVTWHVLKDSVTASPEQIEKFKALYPANYRPVQDGNRRYILLDE